MSSQQSIGPLGRQSWLVRAKLEAPRQQARSIDRPLLIEALERVRRHRLGLLVAPAGFGKTTLLAQWRKELLESDIKVAWLTLDEADAEPNQFLSYLVFAVANAGIEVGKLELLAEQGLMDTAPRLALSAILESIDAAKAPLVVILEDYQRAQCPEIDALIGEIVASAPKTLCLVLNSRVRPQINLPHLLASGMAAEIDAEKLRFTRAEVEGAVDARISSDAVDALFERTEGWPVAVQLAALLVRGKENADRKAIDRFVGHTGHIATYLADQVLATLPEDIRDFLIRTSVVERFTAPLANILCERQDSWEILKRLEWLQALLVPIDEGQTWFRYHHLFTDYLRSLLKQVEPGLEDELHRKASEWFESEGRIAEAVRHAQQSGDFDRCATLIESAGGWELILFGGIGHLRSLLRNIPLAELVRFPRLLLAQSYLFMKEGRIQDARALFDSAASAQQMPEAGSSLERDFVNMRTMLECYEDRPVSCADLEEITKRASSWPENDPLTHGMFDCQIALTNLALGLFDQASESSKTAMRAMRQARSVLGLNYCYLHAGIAAFYKGRLQIAEANLWEARGMAEENFGADSGLKFIADVLLGGFHFWRGELAEESRRGFFRALEHVEQYDGWFEIYAFGFDVALELAIADEDFDRAAASIAQAKQIAATRGLQRLADLAVVYQCKLDKRLGKAVIHDEAWSRLGERYGLGCWRDDPYSWRIYMEIAEAGLAPQGGQLAEAGRVLDDAIECARQLDARFFLVRLLIQRGIQFEQTGRREEAIGDIIDAVQLAAPERIRQPFQADRALGSVLRAAQKAIRQDSGDSFINQFISNALEAMRQESFSRQLKLDTAALSPREQDVVMELRLGQSNKQIARSLDMAENTVKFHLKNIFAKLGVESRAQAIAILNSE